MLAHAPAGRFGPRFFAGGWIIMRVFAIKEDFVHRAADQHANALIEAASVVAAA
jgi:hypothetical protein